MRVLLGWLLLFSAFAAAAFYQSQWSEGLRRVREERAMVGTARTSASLAPTGRARLQLGRPSGAAPIEVARPARRLPPGATDTSGVAASTVPALALSSAPELAADWPEGEAPPSWTPPVYEMRVPAGTVLSKICQDFYGSGRPPIPQRVAEYNGLRSADHLRAGDRLKLPPLTLLGLEAVAPPR